MGVLYVDVEKVHVLVLAVKPSIVLEANLLFQMENVVLDVKPSALEFFVLNSNAKGALFPRFSQVSAVKLVNRSTADRFFALQ